MRQASTCKSPRAAESIDGGGFYRGVATGGISVYIPPSQNQSTLQIFMWLLVVFLFDPGQIVVDFEIGRTS